MTWREIQEDDKVKDKKKGKKKERSCTFYSHERVT